jgi:hypothetical protein
MNKKISRKAQIQNAETIIVIVIVTMMVIIGLVFVVKNKKNNIELQSDDFAEQKAMEVAIVASNFNELRCSEYSAMIKTCYDYQRLLAFSNVLEKNKQNSYEYYYYLLGNSKIDVQIITGNLPPNKQNISLYNYNNSANKSSFPVFIPITVQNSMTKESYFAVIEVRTYS